MSVKYTCLKSKSHQINILAIPNEDVKNHICITYASQMPIGLPTLTMKPTGEVASIVHCTYTIPLENIIAVFALYMNDGLAVVMPNSSPVITWCRRVCFSLPFAF